MYRQDFFGICIFITFPEIHFWSSVPSWSYVFFPVEFLSKPDSIKPLGKLAVLCMSSFRTQDSDCHDHDSKIITVPLTTFCTTLLGGATSLWRCHLF